jgi:hypothetical protein
MAYYDRYSLFKTNGAIKFVPHITIPFSSDDIIVTYKQGVTRLDKLSQTYYNNPYHGVLILMANPSLGGLEFDIQDSKTIRIPYPFESALERYVNEVKIYNMLYGK